jgi:hypothetical protein
MSRDAGKGKIDFVDIASPAYSPADNYGITFDQVCELVLWWAGFRQHSDSS